MLAAPRSRPASKPVDRGVVLAALGEVPDPEIPSVSIVELGMVGEVQVDDLGIRVELLPTFVGCPALEMIRDSVERRLGELGLPVQVEVSFATPWTSDRISRAGREKLRRSGFAPPPHLRAAADRSLPVLAAFPAPSGAAPPQTMLPADIVECPYCGSTRTTLENLFGPTQCRSIRHCPDCRQPFESFKPI
jgi:ring-1,2-phenylacetyl-CoA epoxidase subunit PaaD